ncbi:hypothetical protein BSKO_07698 [Bryopsis sp. KO-2023]|nr:hypothetical protein BSKO_07698 [Bryopsis sp. KO-2023]
MQASSTIRQQPVSGLNRLGQARTGRLSASPIRRGPRRFELQAAGGVARETAEDSINGPESPEQCFPFMDRDGNSVEVMCCDYGFRSGVGRMYQDRYGEIPDNVWGLAVENFKQEWNALRKSFRSDDYKKIADQNPPEGPIGKAAYSLGGRVVQGLASFDESLENSDVFPSLETAEQPTEDLSKSIDDEFTALTFEEVQARLNQLKLSNDAVWKRENKRIAEGGGVKSPWYIKGAYLGLCVVIDVVYNNRPLPRFWFLETVARMPYFSFISMLHLYESLGWWRAGADVRKIHFAEEWNELHHLQIMEALGGDQLWIDRFLALHAAIVYYWFLLLFYLLSPKTAYNFSELVENHAVDTYTEFVEVNEELLKELPPPKVAVQYYRGDDLYMFDDFQTSGSTEPRRPSCENLYDVFKNISDDEMEHVRTMKACADDTIRADLNGRKFN